MGGDNGGKGWSVCRNNYKGHMDKTKGGLESGEGGADGWGGVERLGRKAENYLNNNKILKYSKKTLYLLQ